MSLKVFVFTIILAIFMSIESDPEHIYVNSKVIACNPSLELIIQRNGSQRDDMTEVAKKRDLHLSYSTYIVLELKKLN